MYSEILQIWVAIFLSLKYNIYLHSTLSFSHKRTKPVSSIEHRVKREREKNSFWTNFNQPTGVNVKFWALCFLFDSLSILFVIGNLWSSVAIIIEPRHRSLIPSQSHMFMNASTKALSLRPKSELIVWGLFVSKNKDLSFISCTRRLSNLQISNVPNATRAITPDSLSRDPRRVKVRSLDYAFFFFFGLAFSAHVNDLHKSPTFRVFYFQFETKTANYRPRVFQANSFLSASESPLLECERSRLTFDIEWLLNC